MIKLIVFDLDATLAPSHSPTPASEAKRITELEKQGVNIAICSGKTTYYLCGFARQFGLTNAYLIGENGLTIQHGTFLPPEFYYEMPVSEKAKSDIKKIKAFIDKTCENVWYQPNTVALTPFITSENQFEIIDAYLDRHSRFYDNLTVYKHYNCYDILPKNASKKDAVAFLCGKLGITPNEVITVGDGINDYPMFEFSKYSVGLNVKDESKVTENFRSLAEALDFIETKVGENH
ncbi:MAG: HAD family phosphatase [Clostridiales bacterium]|nr:HAD family phosphatase [Candidatus Equinaster intestinalis]